MSNADLFRVKQALLLAVVLAFGLVLPAVAAAEIPAKDAHIVKVTVYRDRAEVVREAIVEVPVGASVVEFSALPFNVEADTLRVSAEGVPAALGAVEIQDRAEQPRETPEWRAAHDEVRRIEREIAATTENEAVDQELRRFLVSLASVTSTEQTREMSQGRADPDAIRGIYAMMQSELRSLGGAKLDRQDRRRELQEDLELARARLQTLRPASQIRSRVAAVEVEASRAGRLTLQLAYLAPGASWRPSYRATLDAGSGDVELIAEGVVRQSVGEDWNGVELHLSSASPARGVEPPRLASWVLRPVHVGAGTVFGSSPAPLMEEVEVDSYQNVLRLAPGVQDSGDPAEPAAVVETEIVRSAYNVAFRVPGRSDVPADGSDHRVVLRQQTLKSNLVHRTVPGLDDRAFLTAVTTSPDEYPLLAGPVRVFAGGAYLGSFPLKETGPGVELTLPFGVDNRVEVIRVPEPQMKSREGLTGKQRQVRRVERTLLHNLMDHAVTLVVEDRLPVSEDERVVVQLGKDTTPDYRDSERRPGVKLWTIELAPGEQRELVLDYTVRYPKEMTLPGLG